MLSRHASDDNNRAIQHVRADWRQGSGTQSAQQQLRVLFVPPFQWLVVALADGDDYDAMGEQQRQQLKYFLQQKKHFISLHFSTMKSKLIDALNDACRKHVRMERADLVVFHRVPELTTVYPTIEMAINDLSDEYGSKSPLACLQQPPRLVFVITSSKEKPKGLHQEHADRKHVKELQQRVFDDVRMEVASI
jgi:hypothetical protein